VSGPTIEVHLRVPQFLIERVLENMAFHIRDFHDRCYLPGLGVLQARWFSPWCPRAYLFSVHPGTLALCPVGLRPTSRLYLLMGRARGLIIPRLNRSLKIGKTCSLWFTRAMGVPMSCISDLQWIHRENGIVQHFFGCTEASQDPGRTYLWLWL
jgi:hypothetical protein